MSLRQTWGITRETRLNESDVLAFFVFRNLRAISPPPHHFAA
jgi:hypothetical protein